MTAGEIRIAGNVTVLYGDRKLNLRGTNKLVLDGTAAQSLSTDGYNAQVQNLTLANDVGGVTLVDPVSHTIGIGSRAHIYGLTENLGKWNNPAIETVTLDGGLTLRAGSTLNNLGQIKVMGAITNEGATITGNQPAPFAATVKITAAAPTTFAPQTIDVARTGTVTWDNQTGTVQHNVTFTAQSGVPTNIPNWTTGTQSRTFNTAATYNYQCSIHGAAMSGTVVVH
jgi:plastocyanin